MRGYQSNDDWIEPSTNAAEERSTSPLIIAVAFVVVFTLFDGLVWASNGGGIISLIGVLASIHAKSVSIDVDQHGLDALAVLLLCVLLIGTCRVLGIKSISHRRSSLLAIVFVAVMAAFAFGPEDGLIAAYMAEHGYRHCISRDYMVGSGKGEVWFENYVTNAVNCPRAR
jgi:hypothetical protein